ncbi:3',5'-cyclic-AMP phosphodiesterase [Maricurvus nonylphenolicus]|uniref:3',5'-cyclic-AMP phosphodiesterase n=1 Tax=Maricurvus nonylphenolicus TaxID=1008307 RepID=UPI0036F1F3C2
MNNDVKATARPIRLVQITDCHLGQYTGEELLGLDTDESMQDVVDLVKQEQSRVDYILATGDIASGGQPGAYQRFLKTYMSQLPHPMAWLPGNHDLPSEMEKAAGRKLDKLVELDNWLIILLESQVDGSEYGDLSEAELAFLQQALEQNPDHHILVCLHHQPVKVGCAWIDQYQVRSADQFFAIIDKHPQVQAIVWGHVHQDFSRERNGVQLMASPSTCVQFKPMSDEFAVDTVMPGYRWFDLHADGRIETGVSRVAEKAYGIDFASSGY